MMEFNEFLISKKIDKYLFENTEPEVFNEWNILFEKMHPESFVAQKKFSINNTRRKYLLEIKK